MGGAPSASPFPSRARPYPDAPTPDYEKRGKLDSSLGSLHPLWPVARPLGLWLTFVMLVVGLWSASGCGVVERAHRQLAESKAAREAAGHRGGTGAAAQSASASRQEAPSKGRPRSTSAHLPHVGDAATSTTATSGTTLRRAGKARGVLLSLVSHALAQSHGQAGDELASDEAPDLVDDECPQGYAAIPFPGLSLPTLAAPDLAPNLWGIQPSMGHPHGDEEPPRV